MSTTSDPADPRLTRGVDDGPRPQAEVYLVLSEDERARGFVRPVRTSYRHHKPPVGYIVSSAVATPDGRVVGVYTLGRPSAEPLQDGWTCEVTRTCTDGTRNANSCLYGSAWRAARALGYRRAVTYTEDGETGASLRAAGWRPVAELPARPGWDSQSRRRAPGRDQIDRFRWEVTTQRAPFAKPVWPVADDAPLVLPLDIQDAS